MDAFNLDVWKQQWATFMTAPYIIVSFVIGAFFGGWLLRGIKSEGRIAGLEGLVSVFEARLRLADERAALANEVRDGIATQFKDFKAEVAAGAGMDAVIARVTTIEAAIDKLAVANNAVRSAIGVAGRLSAAASSMIGHAETIKPDAERPA